MKPKEQSSLSAGKCGDEKQAANHQLGEQEQKEEGLGSKKEHQAEQGPSPFAPGEHGAEQWGVVAGVGVAVWDTREQGAPSHGNEGTVQVG